MPLFPSWTKPTKPAPAKNVAVHTEDHPTRAKHMDLICDKVLEHLIHESTLDRFEHYPHSGMTIRNRLPESRKIRSGDLGEILGMVYVEESSSFRIPLKRLRHKDDRNTSMRGDDIVAVDTMSPPTVLKAEVKSAKMLAEGTVKKAAEALDRHKGRPNPATLAFIAQHLRAEGRHAEADIFEDLQAGKLPKKRVRHLIFTFSGNDPAKHLVAHCADGECCRELAGLRVTDHQDFIKAVFEACDARYK